MTTYQTNETQVWGDPNMSQTPQPQLPSTPQLDPQLPTRNTSPNYQQMFMEAAGKTSGSTQERYKALEQQLGSQGWQFQKNSGGQYRGRGAGKSP